MAQPLNVAAAADGYLDMLLASERRLIAELQGVVDNVVNGRRVGRLNDLLSSVRTEIGVIRQGTANYLVTTVPELYAQGAFETGFIASHTWSGPHQSAAQAIMDYQYNAVLSATDFMEDDAKVFFRQMARAGNERGAIEGLRHEQAAREMRRLAPRRIGPGGVAKRLDAVIYRNGARHGIVSYSNMLARTTNAIAYNTGATNTFTELGIQHVQVFDGPDCGASSHDDPEKAAGRIWTTSKAAGLPLSHPNCSRSFAGRPDASRLADPTTAPALTPDQNLAQQTIPRPATPPARSRAGRSGRSTRTRRNG